MKAILEVKRTNNGVKLPVSASHTRPETALSALRFLSAIPCRDLHCHAQGQQSSFHQDVGNEYGFRLDALFENPISQQSYTFSFQKSGLASFLHLHLLYANKLHRLDIFRLQTDSCCFPNPFQYLRDGFALSITTRYIRNFGYINAVFILLYQNSELHNTTNKVYLLLYLTIFITTANKVNFCPR